MYSSNKRFKKTFDPAARLEKQKKFVSVVFVCILISQVFLFNGITNLGQTLEEDYNSIKASNQQATEDLINGTIRGQERIMLSSIRQGWVQYLSIHPETELIQKIDGKFIYSNPKGNRVVFDPDTMTKSKIDEAYYDIKDIATGKVIARSVRPQWNMKAVENIINVIGSASKAFGPAGDLLVYDAFSGEVIVDNSGNTKEVSAVLQENGKRNLSLMHKHPMNLNAAQYKTVVDQLMWRKDSDASSKIVSLYSESQYMDPTQLNNFSLYPLGEYKREFIEKVILPYESIGVEGQEMQIGIAIGAQEQEIVSVFSRTTEEMKNSQLHLQAGIKTGIVYPLMSIGISLLTIFFSMFMVRLFSYQSKLSRAESKRGSDR